MDKISLSTILLAAFSGIGVAILSVIVKSIIGKKRKKDFNISQINNRVNGDMAGGNINKINISSSDKR